MLLFVLFRCRYFILYEYGGVYADIDTQALKSLDDISQTESCILAQEPLEHAHFLPNPLGGPIVSNAVMACVPRHRFFRDVINHLERHAANDSIKVNWYLEKILYSTGPFMLTKEYLNYSNNEKPQEHITLALPDVFMPTIGPRALWLQTCKEPNNSKLPDSSIKKYLCKRFQSPHFRNGPSDKSLVNHLWAHTWTPDDPLGVEKAQKKKMFFSLKDLL